MLVLVAVQLRNLLFSATAAASVYKSLRQPFLSVRTIGLSHLYTACYYRR